MSVVFLPTLTACTNTSNWRGNLCKRLLLHSPSSPVLPWGCFTHWVSLEVPLEFLCSNPTAPVGLIAPSCPGSGTSKAAAYPNIKVLGMHLSVRGTGSNQRMPLIPGGWVCSPPRKRRVGGSSQLHVALFAPEQFCLTHSSVITARNSCDGTNPVPQFAAESLIFVTFF